MSFTSIVDDNATKVWRKHEFQFGFHFRDDRVDILPSQQQVAGSDDFATMPTGLYDPTSSAGNPSFSFPYTGDNFANFYLGHRPIIATSLSAACSTDGKRSGRFISRTTGR